MESVSQKCCMDSLVKNICEYYFYFIHPFKIEMANMKNFNEYVDLKYGHKKT